MSQAPSQEMEPAQESVQHVLGLAKRGEYYLFRFPRIDFFKKPEITLEGDGFYRVELIDTWFMRTYLLGYTPAGSQVLLPHLGPGLLRLVKDPQPRPDLPVGSIDELNLIFGQAEPSSPRADAAQGAEP